MTQTITGMFDSRAAATTAATQLMQQLQLTSDQVRIHGSEMPSTGLGAAPEDSGFWAGLKELFMPEDDRTMYAEGVRRGGVVVSATVDEARLEMAMDILEENGAVDLNEREQSWRQSGWTGTESTTLTGTSAGMATGTTTGGMATGTSAGMATGTSTGASQSLAATSTARDTDQVIPIVEETLRVGKRATEGGRVRVRSYVVETAVSEDVTLRQEHVDVQRRSVNRPLTDADHAFEERTIEATEHNEEAVIAKEARVTEELVIRKDASERVETVSETVRRQEVDIEDTRTGVGADSLTGGASRASSNPPGTMASRAVDDVLDTNISGANPKR